MKLNWLLNRKNINEQECYKYKVKYEHLSYWKYRFFIICFVKLRLPVYIFVANIQIFLSLLACSAISL